MRRKPLDNVTGSMKEIDLYNSHKFVTHLDDLVFYIGVFFSPVASRQAGKSQTFYGNPMLYHNNDKKDSQLSCIHQAVRQPA